MLVFTHISTLGPSYSFPSKSSGAAYGGLPHHVFSSCPRENKLLKPKSVEKERRPGQTYSINTHPHAHSHKLTHTNIHTCKRVSLCECARVSLCKCLRVRMRESV